MNKINGKKTNKKSKTRKIKNRKNQQNMKKMKKKIILSRIIQKKKKWKNQNMN